ncbi:MAG: hotdog fold thioesterase [Paludibacter sp.]|nr:hotdog fold thioesterase [Paludibacter sp.]
MNIEQLNIICKGTLMEHLGIEFTELSDERIVARMPVDERTFQPAGRLHGGASAALAESVGSAGSLAFIDTEKYSVLGIDLNATHLAATHQNEVFGIGKIIYKGKTQHVWEIRIEDRTGKLISVCRLTNRIIEK